MKEVSYSSEQKQATTEPSGFATKYRSRGSRTVPTLRTFSRDVEEMVQKENVSKAQIMMAENARRKERGESRPENEHTHLIKIIFVLALILSFAVGVGIYVLIGSRSTPLDIATQEVEKGSAEGARITLSGAAREDILADLTLFKQKVSTGSTDGVVRFVVSTTDGKSRTATTQEILSTLAFLPPEASLLRALNPESEFGMKHDEDGVSGYFLGRVSSYESAFAGMLDWEKNLPRDLLPALNPEFPRKKIIELFGRPFKDERVSGVDARILRDADGKLLLAHAIINRQHIVVTSSEKILQLLTSQLRTETIK
jgi:hypothetical protein